jgi:hypothetical protein
MHRRTLLKSVAALAAAPALPALADAKFQAQSGEFAFTDAHLATLNALADVTLPAAIGADGRVDAVNRFVSWIKNYRAGSDRGHSYGSSTLSPPTGPSPAGRYGAQFAALDAAAVAAGAASFSALAAGQRRQIVETTLSTPQAINNLPARPNGANLIADFMGLYFNSPDATDLAYQAAIGRDICRDLPGSEKAPAPLVKR